MAKRKTNNLDHEPASKRRNVHPRDKVSVGRSANLTSRETYLFDSIVNLVTKNKGCPSCTDRNSLFWKAGNGLFMEYSTEDENLYMFLKCFNGPEMKFLVHPVWKIESVPAARKPLMAFSQNFVDSESWRIIKSAFTLIFGGSVNPSEEDHDFMFAFSRQGDFVHFRSYKILNVPDCSTVEKTLKLSTHSQHICFMAVSFPSIGTRLKLPESAELLEASVFIGIPPSSSVLHIAEFEGSVLHVGLKDVPDLVSWRGFSTCLADFKQRNVPIFSGEVLGSVGVKMNYISDRYKLMIRSLLVEMVKLHNSGWCFSDIAESDVCIRGTNVKISWKVDLKRYGVTAARNNYRSIKCLVEDMFRGFDLPRDFEVLIHLLDSDTLTPGLYLCTHCSLMDDVAKSHLITDIYVEYTSHLLYRHKQLVSQPFCYSNMSKLETSIKSNKYLAAIWHGTGGGESTKENISSRVSLLNVFKQEEVGVDSKKGVSPLLTPLDKVTMLSRAIIHARHCIVHLKEHFKKERIVRFHAREEVRMVTYALPDLLHMLQNELRYILGDGWYFSEERAGYVNGQTYSGVKILRIKWSLAQYLETLALQFFGCNGWLSQRHVGFV